MSDPRPLGSGAPWRELVAAAAAIAAALVAAVVLVDPATLLARPPWYDETLTLLVADHPDFGHGLRGLAAGVEHHPPTYYLFVRALGVLCGGVDETVLRAGSVAAAGAALVCLYAMSRRAVSPAAAAVAVLLTAAHPLVVMYAFEGRSYALWLALLGAFAWLLAARDDGSGRGRLHAVALAVVSVLLASVHYLAVLSLLLVWTGDIVAGRRGARLRSALPGLAGLGASLALVPLALAQRRTLAVGSWIPPLSAETAWFTAQMLAPPLVAFGAVVVLGLGASFREAGTPFARWRERGARLAGLLALLALPLLLALLSIWVQPVYPSRYAVAFVLGLGAVGALLAAPLPRGVALVALGGLAFQAGTLVDRFAAEKAAWARSTRAMLSAIEGHVGSAEVLFELPEILYPLCRLGAPCADRFLALDFPDGALPGLDPGFVVERDVARAVERHFGSPRTCPLQRARRLPRLFVLAAGSGGDRLRLWFPEHRARRVEHSLFLLERAGPPDPSAPRRCLDPRGA